MSSRPPLASTAIESTWNPTKEATCQPGSPVLSAGWEPRRFTTSPVAPPSPAAFVASRASTWGHPGGQRRRPRSLDQSVELEPIEGEGGDGVVKAQCSCKFWLRRFRE